MKLRIDATGIATDAWLEDFARATAAFALWHHELDVQAVSVRLAPKRERDAPNRVLCTLIAEVGDLGSIEASASGARAWQAIERAAERLEVALFEGLLARDEAASERLAA